MCRDDVIVRGPVSSLEEWQRRIDKGFNPRRLLFFIPDEYDDLPGLLQTREAADRTTAFLCKGVECLAPIQDLEELATRLSSAELSTPQDGRQSPG